MTRQFTILGQDVSAYVYDWGSVDDVKDMLLAQTQLFAGQYQIKLLRGDTLFSPYAKGSLFYGRPLLNQPATLTLNGQVAYNGLLKSVDIDGTTRQATLTMENYLSKPTSIIANLTANGANPATAMLSILTAAGLSLYVDTNSFESAGSGASAAGATINVAYLPTKTTTVLAALQAISQLCSITVFVQNGLIRARTWTPYEGNGSGIKWTIDQNAARTWKTLTQAYDNLNNSVTIGYGASSSVALQDTASIARYQITNTFPFSTNTGGELAVPDLVSAQYFGQLFLDRASTVRGVVEVDAGPSLIDAELGDRVYLTAPNLGMTLVPAEIIETHRSPLDNGIALKLATI